MKNKFLKSAICYLLSISMAIPSFATVTEADDKIIITKDSLNNTETESVESQVTVYAEFDSYFNVIIPKTLILDGIKDKDNKNTGYYTVSVNGDISGQEEIEVVPDESFLMSQVNKSDVTSLVDQTITHWTYDDLGTDAIGTVSTTDTLSAGSWNGVFYFNIKLNEKGQVLGDMNLPDDLDDDYRLLLQDITKNPGLYDKDGNLIVTWPELEKEYGIDATLPASNEKSPSSIINKNYPETVYVSLPENITQIGSTEKESGPFGDLSNVKYIYIPSTVKEIKPNSFSGSGITHVSTGSTTIVRQGAFDNTPAKSNGKIYVGGSSVSVVTTTYETIKSQPKVDDVDLTLKKGHTYQITALYNFINDVTKESTITSQNPNIVTFIPDCYLEAKNVGTTIISGTYFAPNGNQKYAELKIKVIDDGSMSAGSSTNTPSHTHTFNEYGVCIICGGINSSHEHNFVDDKCITCGYIRNVDHTHTYDNAVYEIIKEPTCTQNGSKKYFCKCGQTKIESIEALGHDFVDNVCTRCNKTYTEYNYEKIILQEGNYSYTFNLDKNDKRQVVVLDKDGNDVSKYCNFNNNFTDENGCLDLSKHNNITGATFSVVYHKDEITTHTFSVCIIIEHNFDEHGICKCGEVSSSHVHEYKDGECIYCHAKQEHICDFNEDDITKATTIHEATCTTEGLIRFTCSCGKTKDVKTNKLEHTPIVADNKVEPTCTSNGREADIICSVCKKTLETGDYIDALGHDFGEPIYIWSSNGESCAAKQICTRNSEHTNIEYAKITSQVKIPATCTEKGTTTYTADFTKFGYEIQTKDIQDIDVLPHDFSTDIESAEVIKEATCSNKGIVKVKCNNCDTTKNIETDKLDHTPIVADNKIEPTCTNHGKEADIICSKCNKIIEEGAIINAIEHSLKITSEPTCTECGLKECINCGYTEQINKLEHELKDPVIEEEDGIKYEVIYCNICNEQIIKTEIDINNHKHNFVNYLKPWNKTSDGTYRFVQDGDKWISNNKGVKSSTASSTWTIYLDEESDYSFNYKVSSEANYDKLTIKIDGVTVVNAISGDGTELTYKTKLSAGNHTITATYVKDSSADKFDDCGYIILNNINQGYICNICDELKSHEWSEWVIDKDSTCTEMGKKHKQCIYGKEIVYEDIELKPHIFENNECINCGKKESDYFEEKQLSELNWNEINYLTVNNKLKEHYSIGDYKEVEINGVKCRAILVDMNDSYADFITSVSVINEMYQNENTGILEGGKNTSPSYWYSEPVNRTVHILSWKNSTLRERLNSEEIYGQLNSDLKDVIIKKTGEYIPIENYVRAGKCTVKYPRSTSNSYADQSTQLALPQIDVCSDYLWAPTIEDLIRYKNNEYISDKAFSISGFTANPNFYFTRERNAYTGDGNVLPTLNYTLNLNNTSSTLSTSSNFTESKIANSVCFRIGKDSLKENNSNIEWLSGTPGIYDANLILIKTWDELGIENNLSNFSEIIQTYYPQTVGVILSDDITTLSPSYLNFTNCKIKYFVYGRGITDISFVPEFKNTIYYVPSNITKMSGTTKFSNRSGNTYYNEQVGPFGGYSNGGVAKAAYFEVESELSTWSSRWNIISAALSQGGWGSLDYSTAKFSTGYSKWVKIPLELLYKFNVSKADFLKQMLVLNQNEIK